MAAKYPSDDSMDESSQEGRVPMEEEEEEPGQFDYLMDSFVIPDDMEVDFQLKSPIPFPDMEAMEKQMKEENEAAEKEWPQRLRKLVEEARDQEKATFGSFLAGYDDINVDEQVEQIMKLTLTVNSEPLSTQMSSLWQQEDGEASKNQQQQDDEKPGPSRNMMQVENAKKNGVDEDAADNGAEDAESSKVKVDNINDLPDYVLQHIFSFITVGKDVQNGSLVCRKWHKLLYTERYNHLLLRMYQFTLNRWRIEELQRVLQMPQAWRYKQLVLAELAKLSAPKP